MRLRFSVTNLQEEIAISNQREFFVTSYAFNKLSTAKDVATTVVYA
jgi:hypothetical protein